MQCKEKRRCDMENVKPEMVIEILKKHNVQVSVEQAQMILAFMFKLATIVVNKKERS